MEISRKSWHYKRANSFNFVPSKSLCLYFWQVVWGVVFWWILLPVSVVIFTVALFGCLPLAVGTFLIDVFGYVETGPKWVKALWGFGAGYLFFLTFFTLMGAFAYYRKVKSRKDSTTKKEDNLFIAYIKAKKRKICPLIEFTYEDK